MKINDGIYVNGPLREVAGPCLRPGGADLTRHGLALCAFPPGALVLDLGCGPGGTLAVLKEAGLRFLGLDRSAALLSEALRERAAPLLRADMAALPLQRDSLDGIVCECVLSLADDKRAVLAECARALKPGGRLLLCDLVRRFRPETPGAERLGPSCSGGLPCAGGAEYQDALAAMLGESGFAVRAVEDHTKALRDLAARIVWRFGSLAALAVLLPGGGSGTDRDGGGQTECDGGRALGYCLIIAEKQGE